MVRVEVEANFEQFIADAKQLPFATALALTNTARDIQAEEQRQLHQRFVIRNTWVEKGITIRHASKRDLEAVITSERDFMVLHETGGTKTPISGASVAVPREAAGKRGIVGTGDRPSALRGTPGVFRKTIGGVDGLWQRLKRRTKERKARGHTLKLLFIFKASVPIVARFGFFETGKRVAADRFPRQFDLAMAHAKRTAK